MRRLAGVATFVVVLVAASTWWLGEESGVHGAIGALVGLTLLAVLTYAAPSVLGGMLGLIEGLREGAAGKPPDHDAVEHLRSLTISDVRARADQFERSGRRSRLAADGRQAYVYEVPAFVWRRLETEMRSAGASVVGDLPERSVESWARRLGLARDNSPWYPDEHGPPEVTPQVRVVDDDTRPSGK